jgi:hypothetical protein
VSHFPYVCAFSGGFKLFSTACSHGETQLETRTCENAPKFTSSVFVSVCVCVCVWKKRWCESTHILHGPRPVRMQPNSHPVCVSVCVCVEKAMVCKYTHSACRHEYACKHVFVCACGIPYVVWVSVYIHTPTQLCVPSLTHTCFMSMCRHICMSFCM